MKISKEEFVDAIQAYQDLNRWQSCLISLGMDISEAKELQEFICKYIDLLNLLTEQKRRAFENTELEYFVFDVGCGEFCDTYYIEQDGKIIKWHNAEEFWNYLEPLENQLDRGNLN